MKDVFHVLQKWNWVQVVSQKVFLPPILYLHKDKEKYINTKPMHHLWDKASKNLTNFTTHFSFVIDTENQTEYADGMTFFLTPWGSTIPMPTEGRDLGLTRIDHPLNSTNNPFFFL